MNPELKKAMAALAVALEIIDSKNRLLEGVTAIAEQAIKELTAAELKLSKLQEVNH